MVEPADREFLRSIFLMEAWETVAALETGVEDAGRGDREALHVVTHRLKGAASLYGYPAVAAIAAELEILLESTPFEAARLAALLAELKRALDAPADATSDATSVETGSGSYSTIRCGVSSRRSTPRMPTSRLTSSPRRPSIWRR